MATNKLGQETSSFVREQDSEQSEYFEALEDERREHMEYVHEANQVASKYEASHKGQRTTCDRCGRSGRIGDQLYIQPMMIGFADYELCTLCVDGCQDARNEEVYWEYIFEMRALNVLCDWFEGRVELRCDDCGAILPPDTYIEMMDGEVWAVCEDRSACDARMRLQEEGF